MADNGVDIACMDDADARWRTCTGDALVLQCVYHSIITESVLGRIINDDGTVESDPRADDYGIDVRKLVGSAQVDDDVGALGPLIARAIQKRPRVATCDVVVTSEDAGNGNVNLILDVTGTSAAGPFAFVFRASSTTVKLLSGVTS